jgi:hypothetical protein
VRSAGDTAGVEIRLVKVPWIKVSGKVIGPFQASDRVFVTALRDGLPGGMTSTGMMTTPGHSFESWRLDPGHYTLRANWNAPGGQYQQSVPVAIDVAGANIENLELRFVAPFDLAGRLEFENDEAKQLPQPPQAQQGGRQGSGQQQPPPKPVRRVLLRDTASGNYSQSAQAQVQDDDTFTFSKLSPGRYRATASWGTAYVKSVRVGPTVTDGSMVDVSNGAAGELSVMLGAANASITGTVIDEQEKPTGSLVALVQNPPEPGLIPRYVSVRADGTYAFPNLAPGSYKIVALQRNDMIPAQQPGGLVDYEDLMEPIEVHPGDKITRDLHRRAPM